MDADTSILVTLSDTNLTVSYTREDIRGRTVVNRDVELLTEKSGAALGIDDLAAGVPTDQSW